MWLINWKTASAILVTFGSFIVNVGVQSYPMQAAEKLVDQRVNGGLTVAEFELLHQKLTKMSTEKVWSIPWQLSVREARELAAKQNKPVFLWISSNGGTHPLGPC